MKTKKFIVTVSMIALIGAMSGCVYSNNESWDDLSVEEQQEVQEALDNAREEMKADLSDGAADVALKIIDKVEEAITD